MTDLECLLHAILADPADDAVRLVYADALEENDQADRAKFIRTQIEFDKHPFADNIRSNDYDARDGIDDIWQMGFYLYSLQEQLLNRYRQQWFRLEGFSLPWSNFLNDVVWSTGAGNSGSFYLGADVRAGFITEIRGSMDLLMDKNCRVCGGSGYLHNDMHYSQDKCNGLYGRGCTGHNPGPIRNLVKSNPVELITVACREPEYHELDNTWRFDCWGCLGDYKHYLPRRIIEKMPGVSGPDYQQKIYPFREAAMFALSIGLLADARGEPFIDPYKVATKLIRPDPIRR